MKHPNVYIYPSDNYKKKTKHLFLRRFFDPFITLGIFSIVMAVIFMFPAPDIVIISVASDFFLMVFFINILRMLLFLYKEDSIRNSTVIRDNGKILVIHDSDIVTESDGKDYVYVNDVRLCPVDGYIGLAKIADYIENKECHTPSWYEDKSVPALISMLDDPWSDYQFYTDCYVENESRNYLLFRGTEVCENERIPNQKFRIYKAYKRLRSENICVSV